MRVTASFLRIGQWSIDSSKVIPMKDRVGNPAEVTKGTVVIYTGGPQREKLVCKP